MQKAFLFAERLRRKLDNAEMQSYAENVILQKRSSMQKTVFIMQNRTLYAECIHKTLLCRKLLPMQKSKRRKPFIMQKTHRPDWPEILLEPLYISDSFQRSNATAFYSREQLQKTAEKLLYYVISALQRVTVEMHACERMCRSGCSN